MVLVALAGSLAAQEVQARKRVNVAEGIDDGPLKAPVAKENMADTDKLSTDDQAYFRRLESKLREYLPDAKFNLVQGKTLDPETEAEQAAAAKLAQDGKPNTTGEVRRPTGPVAGPGQTPVDFDLPEIEVTATQLELAVVREMLRNPEKFKGEEGWAKELVRKHLSDLDANFLNKYTLGDIIPFFGGESAEARALRMEQYERNRKWEGDMKRLIDVMEAAEMPETKGMEKSIADDLYERR